MPYKNIEKRKEYKKKYKLLNSKKIKEAGRKYRKKYYREHIEECRLADKIRRDKNKILCNANPEILKKQQKERKEYRDSHKKETALYQFTYNTKNKQKITDLRRLYKKLHPEKAKMYDTKYRAKKETIEKRRNPVEKEKRRISRNKWGKNNPDVLSSYRRKRRSLKLRADGSHTQKEWDYLKVAYNFMCLCCKKVEPYIKLTEDHIIPLTKGGTDNIENIQPLCRSCNSKKGTKLIPRFTC